MAAAVLLVAGCEGDPAASKGKDSGKPGAAPVTAATATAGASMPALIGKKSADAEALVQQVTTKPVETRSAYGDVPLAADHTQWAVCFQTPAAASPLAADTAVELSLTAPGTPCPAQAGAALRPSGTPSPARTTVPSKAPAPAPSSAPVTPKPKSSPTPAPGPKDVTYKNCAEAKAAGVAPIHRGQPGYAKHLDRDDDGIACDK
ncbi:excalibur calcium-binding domain-containing protein [Streptomyces sp. NPDC006544]|uniref:excalibur calcium-binding domain-containing protein n=1 Tax=Streptomyces sp. NPDC006544 TaxID=3154583 RepID=UPI0033B4F7B1